MRNSQKLFIIPMVYQQFTFLKLNDIIIYLISVYIGSISSFIYKIIIARILGPAEYGLWNMLSLILLYGSFLDLGSVFALVKQISFYSGQKKQNEVDEIRNTTFFSITIIAMVVGITIVIASIFFNKFDRRFLAIFSLIAFILISNEIRKFFFCNFIAEKKFRSASAIIVYSSLFGILTIILVKKFGLIGLPLGISIGNLLVLSYIFTKYVPLLKFQINIKKFLSLVKVGFPIMLLFITFWLFLTIDRILIFKYLGKLAIGYYGIASALTGFIILFPLSLGIFIFPRLSEKYGANGHVRWLEKFINIPTTVLAYFVSALSGLIYLVLPIAVKILTPQYVPGINAARIALLGTVFLSTSIFSQKLLITINHQLDCLFIALSALIFKAVLTYIFIGKHMGIEGVAIAANIVCLVYSISIIMYTSYLCKNTFLESIKYLIKIFLPLLYLLLILFCFTYFKQHPVLNIDNKIILISINFLLSIIFIAVPFGYVIKKNLCAYLNLDIYKDKT